MPQDDEGRLELEGTRTMYANLLANDLLEKVDLMPSLR